MEEAATAAETRTSNRRGPVRDVPAVLTLYSVFCVVATVALVALPIIEFVWPLAGLREIHDRALPYLGWSAATPYMFSLYFVFHMRRAPSRRLHRTILAFLLLGIGIAAADLLVNGWARADASPYLALQPARFLWSVGVPAAWLLMLSSRRVRTFAATGAPTLAAPL